MAVIMPGRKEWSYIPKLYSGSVRDTSRSGVNFEATPAAVNRWNPDLVPVCPMNLNGK